MSKQINIFIEAQMADEPEVREEYLEKLKRIRTEPHIGPFNSIEELDKAILGGEK